MGTTGTVVTLALGVGLLVALGVVLRRGGAITWPVIGLAALGSGLCFVLAGAHVDDGPGPGPAIICGGLGGIMCLLGVVVVLLPSRSTDGPPGRLPVWLAGAGVLLGAAGLVFTPLAG